MILHIFDRQNNDPGIDLGQVSAAIENYVDRYPYFGKIVYELFCKLMYGRQLRIEINPGYLENLGMQAAYKVGGTRTMIFKDMSQITGQNLQALFNEMLHSMQEIFVEHPFNNNTLRTTEFEVCLLYDLAMAASMEYKGQPWDGMNLQYTQFQHRDYPYTQLDIDKYKTLIQMTLDRSTAVSFPNRETYTYEALVAECSRNFSQYGHLQGQTDGISRLLQWLWR